MVAVERSRVRMPSVRESWLKGGPGTAPERRGRERFIEVDWDLALDLVAAELDRVRTNHGNEAIYAGSYGWASTGRFHHAPTQLHGFMNSIGGYTRSVNTYSLAAAEVIVHHHQDLNRLERAWQRPDTVVVNEPFWTATAKRADVVLPSTTGLERNDIGGAPNDSHLFAMHQAIDPVGGARNDYEIFGQLADRLGVGEAFSEGRTGDQWVRHLYRLLREREPGCPRFEEFWEAGFLDRRFAGDEPKRVLLEDFREDPVANPLSTPSGKIELYSETIAGFGYEDCPPPGTCRPDLPRPGGEVARRGTRPQCIQPSGNRPHGEC